MSQVHMKVHRCGSRTSLLLRNRLRGNTYLFFIVGVYIMQHLVEFRRVEKLTLDPKNKRCVVDKTLLNSFRKFPDLKYRV